jgi:hypothetical protein
VLFCGEGAVAIGCNHFKVFALIAVFASVKEAGAVTPFPQWGGRHEIGEPIVFIDVVKGTYLRCGFLNGIGCLDSKHWLCFLTVGHYEHSTRILSECKC